MSDPYCDCGACCIQCGHDPGCMSLEVQRAVQQEEEASQGDDR